jgi:hypothetical protein
MHKTGVVTWFEGWAGWIAARTRSELDGRVRHPHNLRLGEKLVPPLRETEARPPSRISLAMSARALHRLRSWATWPTSGRSRRATRDDRAFDAGRQVGNPDLHSADAECMDQMHLAPRFGKGRGLAQSCVHSILRDGGSLRHHLDVAWRGLVS